jgi:hypothetical protein
MSTLETILFHCASRYLTRPGGAVEFANLHRTYPSISVNITKMSSHETNDLPSAHLTIDSLTHIAKVKYARKGSSHILLDRGR